MRLKRVSGGWFIKSDGTLSLRSFNANDVRKQCVCETGVYQTLSHRDTETSQGWAALHVFTCVLGHLLRFVSIRFYLNLNMFLFYVVLFCFCFGYFVLFVCFCLFLFNLFNFVWFSLFICAFCFDSLKSKKSFVYYICYEQSFFDLFFYSFRWSWWISEGQIL